MKISAENLQHLKQATSETLEKARALGDPDAIARAKRNDDFVEELIQKNGQVTLADMVRLAVFLDQVVEWLDKLSDLF